MQWEVLVGAAQAGNEMVLKHASCSFGGIASVHVWGHQLEVNVFISHELLQHVGAFVVEALQTWTQSAADEESVSFLACCQD